MANYAKTVLIAIPLFILYLIFAGTFSVEDVVFGALASLTVSTLISEVLVKQHRKLTELNRLAVLIKYFFHYITAIEFRAHSDVIKRIFSPKMPINPGIVKVPYHVETDYALVTIANSITNTPGTVVVDVDKEEKKLFVHWIDVKGIDEKITYEKISKTFEKYAKRIFD